MQNRSIVTLLLFLLTLSTPTAAAGQLGAIIDWINGLSGPGITRVGLEVAAIQVDDRNHINLAGLYGVHVRDRGNADTEAADINALSIQTTLESILLGAGGPVELRSRLGVELHRFTGEFDETVWATSFPALLTLHFPIDGFAFEIGTGFNVFKFQEDDFSPYDVGVATSGFDAGWTVQAAVELTDLW